MFKKTNTNVILCCIQAENCSFAKGVNNFSAASNQDRSVIEKKTSMWESASHAQCKWGHQQSFIKFNEDETNLFLKHNDVVTTEEWDTLLGESYDADLKLSKCGQCANNKMTRFQDHNLW